MTVGSNDDANIVVVEGCDVSDANIVVAEGYDVSDGREFWYSRLSKGVFKISYKPHDVVKRGY